MRVNDAHFLSEVLCVCSQVWSTLCFYFEVHILLSGNLHGDTRKIIACLVFIVGCYIVGVGGTRVSLECKADCNDLIFVGDIRGKDRSG